MRKLLLAAAALCSLAAPAFAQTVEDPLHGCYTTGCTTFGTVSIGTTGTFSGWGFSSSPGAQTGQLYIEMLVPTNEGAVALPTLTGTVNGNPATIGAWVNVGLFSPGSFLDSSIGINGSPSTPYNAYAPNTQLLDSGFVAGTDSYTVYQAIVTAPNPLTLNAAPGQTTNINDIFSLVGGEYAKGVTDFTGVGPGSILTAFLLQPVESCTHGRNPVCTPTGEFTAIATANSSSLILDVPGTPVTFTGGVPEPGTWAMFLAGFGLLGVAGWRKNRLARIAV